MNLTEWIEETETHEQSLANIANEGALWFGITEWLEQYEGETENEF